MIQNIELHIDCKTNKFVQIKKAGGFDLKQCLIARGYYYSQNFRQLMRAAVVDLFEYNNTLFTLFWLLLELKKREDF